MRARIFFRERSFRRTTCLPTSGRIAPTYVIAARENVVLFEGVEGVRCQSVIYFLARLLFVSFFRFVAGEPIR